MILSKPIRVRKPWFESRIFISLSIVIVISMFSFLAFDDTPTVIETAGRWLGLSGELSLRYGYLALTVPVIFASLLRMWAGSILSSEIIMSFKIQNSKFLISGPYKYVRNPLYLSDLTAFVALSLCLKPIGLLIPVMIWLHYYQLIKYEEEQLKNEFGEEYKKFCSSTPALFPGVRQIKSMFSGPVDFLINFDGFRHNAQYVLFVPGLIVAAHTGNFVHAILIGLPAVLDWAVIHTKKGLSPNPASTKEFPGTKEFASEKEFPRKMKITGKNKFTSKKEFASEKEYPGTKEITSKMKINGKKSFSRSKVFRDVLYAQCWEDPELDRIAFKIKPGDTVFSITSGGCNALAFLVDDPERVICLDMNKYQNYLLRLKISAFKSLSYNELLEFMGVHPSERRLRLFEKIKPLLNDHEQSYWSTKGSDIERGIIHCGRYERYMHLLSRLFSLLVGRSVIRRLYDTSGREERLDLFEKRWENLRWRWFCRIFLSRAFASMLFDKAFYRYLEPGFSFEKYYRARVRKAVTELPLEQNYFLAYILLGNYYKDNLPVYLKRENYDIIRKRADRINIITSGCLDYFRILETGTISRFNFTNIFEWMAPDEFSTLLKETIRVARNGAIITYRNHLVTRKRPESLADQIYPDEKLSAELNGRDLSFIYKAYVVEQIVKR